MAQPNFRANGNINPSRFCVQDTTTNKAVLQASGATSFIVGVSQEYADTAPIPGASTLAAVAGEPIKVYSLGDICLLQSTTAGWTAGDRLTSDASGNGIAASGTDYYGAVALTTVSGAGLGQVQVVFGKNP